MENTELHIGSLIKQRLEELGMKKSEFARRISTTSQNVYGIFKRVSIDTDLLKKISETLNFDFFQYYAEGGLVIQEDSVHYNSTNKKVIKTAFDLKTELDDSKEALDALKREVQYLREINELLKEKVNKLINY